MTAPQLIYDIGRPFTAHDVRKLRPCALCNHAGYLPQMLVLEGKNYHSACIAVSMTREQILALPPDQSTKLRLNEIGRDLMMELLNRTEEGHSDDRKN